MDFELSLQFTKELERWWKISSNWQDGLIIVTISPAIIILLDLWQINLPYFE